jgi:hypothetical protein
MQLQGPLLYIVAATDLVWLVLAVVAMVHFWRLATHLEFSHKDVWLKLGRPRFLTSEPYAALVAPLWLQAFVWSRQYRQLGDPETTRLGNKTLAYFVATFAVLFVLLFLPHQRFSGVTSGGGRWSIFI